MAKRKHSMRNLILRNGIYQFKKTVAGVPKQFSLDTDNLELAKVRRDAKLAELDKTELSKLRGPRAGNTRLGDVLKIYAEKIRTVNDRIEESTVKANVKMVTTFFQWTHGKNGCKDESWTEDKTKDFLVRDLTDSLASDFKSNYLAAAGDDREKREQRRRGADSVLAQMKSVFSKDAMRLYRELHLPDLTPFLEAARIETEPRQHKPIAAATLKAMNDAMAERLAANPTDPLWLVHALHKFTGLRNDEICQARVEWFVRAPWGQVFISIITRPYFEPKGNEGHVPIHSSVAALLAPFVANKQPQDFLLTAETPAKRAKLVDREHADWMRQFLPAKDYAKAGYELRRWAAQTMELRHGLDASENFLRHARKGVANAHYLEAWARWKRLGTDVGITLEDAAGKAEGQIITTWLAGAEALVSATPAKAQAPARRFL